VCFDGHTVLKKLQSSKKSGKENEILLHVETLFRKTTIFLTQNTFWFTIVS